MSTSARAAAIASLTFPLAAYAVPDGFDLGDGHSGPIAIAAANTVVNNYAAVTAAVPNGTTSVAVTNGALFSAGDLVLIRRATGMSTTPTSGNQTAVDLASNAVAHFELARVTSVSTNTLLLAAGLRASFPLTGTQVIRVPEYTTVFVPAGTSIAATPWNGQTGGVVAFLANDQVTLNGFVTASAAGFRGGPFVNQAFDLGCTGLDPPPPGGRKGEGLYPSGFAATSQSRGNLANGAGGGACGNAGGGGGGNGGQGGRGGNSHSTSDGGRPVGGLGGAAVSGTVLDRLTLGGGGGAGHGDSAVGTAGGIGGGIVFVRALALAGTGIIAANGQTAANSGADGAGGGGAGGTLYLRFRNGAACGGANARGGNGGNHSPTGGADRGPGGGGGGGRALLQGDPIACPVNVNAGLAGLSNGTSFGATPTSATDPTSVGANQTPPPGGYQRPPAPAITFPTAGTVLNTATPTYAGTASTGASVEVFVDGVSIGFTTAAGGAWSLAQPAALAQGSHQVAAAATLDAAIGPTSAPVAFTVDSVAPPPPTITAPASGSVTGSRTPPVAGSAEANSTVAVTVDALAPVTATATGTGAFSLTSPQLADGSHTATATATDAAGNTSAPSAQVSFTVDTTAPSPPTILDPAPGSATNDPTPPISGTTEANALIAITVDARPPLSATADGAGAFATTSPALADGFHSVSATATDSAGNTSAPGAAVSFTVDTTPPSPPTILAPAPGSATNDPTPPISGTTEADASVTITVDARPPLSATANGAGAFATTSPALIDGPHTASATATDSAGNTSAPGASVQFTVDTQAPSPPTITAPSNGSSTRNRTPTILGNAEANAQVEVRVDAAAPLSAAADGTGAFGVVSPSLADGSHIASATATDRAGNRSSPGPSVTFNVDATAPAAPVIDTPSEGAGVGPRPTIGGTTESFTTVTLRIDGAVPAAAPVIAGRFSYTPTANLAVGPHTAVAVAADAVQNSSPPSSPRTFEVLGVADGGRPTDGGDAGVAADAGPGADAGAPGVDAGSGGALRLRGGGGCGCGGGGSAAPLATIGAVGIAASRRRRARSYGESRSGSTN